ncbi:MAG: fibronectin type III domain-containing protein [Candidatus Gracilibacteria bacterium]|nr:fibronectin type III domain-containing protein [Candidatus Gracilibacteria bacterium]
MFNNFFKKIILTFSVVFFIFGASSVSADFKATSIKSDNIDFSWTAVKDVFIYKINYGNDSSTVVKYDKVSDTVNSTSYKVFDLTPGTKYYFTLVGFDDLGKENYKSEEISVTTLGKGEVNNLLYLEDSNMVGIDKVELTFSNEINDLSAEEREFRVENVLNSNDILEVLSSEVSKTNKKNLVLTLDKEPVIGEQYKVTVLNIRDIYNQNIEFGVDSEATFIGTKLDENNNILNSANNQTSNNQDLNANTNSGNMLNSTDSGVVVTSENSSNPGNLGGMDLNSADINGSVLGVSDEASKLPKTGPEEILIFILAFIVSGIIFAYRFRKI